MKKSKKETKAKRFISVLLAAIMMVCFIVPEMDAIIYAQNDNVAMAENALEDTTVICSGDVYTYEEDDYVVKYMIDGVWDSNYTARIEITNKKDSPIHNWMISFQCEDEISNIYNAQIVKHEGALYHIKNLEYNQDIPAWGTVSFGFQATYSDSADIPHPYVVLSEDSVVASDSYQSELCITNAWDGGYTCELIITNIGNATIEDWYLICETEDDIVTVWNATLDTDEEYEVIHAADYQQNINAGESYVIGLQVSGNSQNIIIHSLNELKYKEETDDSGAGNDKEDTSDTDGEENGNTDMNEDITEYDIIVNTDAFRKADIENTYYVEEAVYELSGELIGYENVKRMEYVLNDINGYTLLQGVVFDSEAGKEPQAQWNIGDFGLAIGCNVLNFKLTLKDDTVIEDKITFIDLYGENMDRVNVDLSDGDTDGLNNYFESVLGTDAQLGDTDGDSLSDFDEFILLGTDPTLADTDGNGIEDSLEDYDGDGLNTVEEMTYGTNIVLTDSDYDGVDDGVEVNELSSNPMLEDTDGDGLLDGEECVMGLNPILTDSDGDGIIDCNEIILQTTCIDFEDDNTSVSKIDVTLECAGAIDKEVYIEDMAGRNCLSNGVVGLVGSPINIHTNADFEEAEIVFHYEPEKLGNTAEENLGVLWYDVANNQFVIMDNVSVDTEQHTVTCITTHFSEYMLVDKEEWYSVWMQASEYVPVYSPCDIAIISDETAPTFHYWTRGYGYINFPNGYIDGENIIYGYYNAEGAHTSGTSWATNQIQYEKAVESIFYYHFIMMSYAPRNGDGKYGDGFAKMVEMFSDSYYEMLHSDNSKVVLFTYGGTILETAEQNRKVEESVEKLNRMGVTVYAVSETGATSSIIENAAISTGGEHFNVCTQEETQKLWWTIHEKVSDLDTDTDKDGLPDVYEINGMRLPNGAVITTDPDIPDTDNDGRPDGEEMGELVDVVVEVDGEGTKKTFQIYKWVSDPNVADTLSDGFIYVESMDYMPECKKLDDDIYNNLVTGETAGTTADPVDREGLPIHGLSNLHSSLDMPTNDYEILKSYTTWLMLINTADRAVDESILPLELLKHFFENSGTAYYYDGKKVYSSSVKLTSLYNFYDFKDECVKAMEPGEIRYLATSPSNDWSGSSDLSGDILGIVRNPIAFASVNSSRAAMVAECSYDGDLYTLKFKYYILDYYDWDYSKQPELYDFNVYGLCDTYRTEGVITGYATFTKDSEITICVTSI